MSVNIILVRIKLVLKILVRMKLAIMKLAKVKLAILKLERMKMARQDGVEAEGREEWSCFVAFLFLSCRFVKMLSAVFAAFCSISAAFASRLNYTILT